MEVNDTINTNADNNTNDTLKVMSWNVAGWIRTAKLLIKYHGSIYNYLTKHDVDVLAVQESKVSKSRASSTETVEEAIPKGYDVYWSHSTTKPGFNGVCTLVRRGLLVRDVLTKPFDDARFDDEGRCLVTFHGGDVALVNVYVPNGGEGGKRIPYKMQFLCKLRKLCRKIRKDGWKVILAGDLNMSPDPRDVCWEYRMIDINTLLASPPTGVINKALSSTTWNRIMNIMSTREIAKIGSDRYRVKVDLNGNSPDEGTQNTESTKIVYLGAASNSPLSLRTSFNFNTVLLEDGSVAKKSGFIEVDELFEILAKTAGVHVPVVEQRAIADKYGMGRGNDDIKNWLEGMKGDGMKDSFREAHPSAVDRFTCWDQYRNKRYTNSGTRIDYILTDDSLPIIIGAPLPLGCDAKAALRCATADGQHVPAPRFGEDKGIPEMDSRAAIEWEFEYCSRPFRTGIVYTAPLFSDHVAVTTLLQVDITCPGAAHVDDVKAKERLREAQTHMEGRRPPKGNQDISQFFRSMKRSADKIEQPRKEKTKPEGIRRWLKPRGSCDETDSDNCNKKRKIEIIE
ncbi:hypothetical protein FOL47_004285 [Perkinsus chesapeaki]|uniref:DNA-(apurinic or apyrimidinic site) endonuclease n=1 Tax=Perkinsus chesapeaki TaxID=330153 RepID=A0A7J6M3C2_PERCH|nr:hypothetical protein FOL47_004285 [Perkinsus chesapeaki]